MNEIETILEKGPDVLEEYFRGEDFKLDYSH